MNRRPLRKARGLRQRGFALIAILCLAALITAYLIATGLTRSSTDVANEVEDRNMSALRQAKAALVAYAASEEWQLHKALPLVPPAAYYQPGALPSPDTDGDGDADSASGPNTFSQIGRLPWRTLGIEDLRDSSGERLWYALSHDFRKMRCNPPPPTPAPLGCTRINSDTQGQLSVVTGTAPASNVVAVLIAPGTVLQGQDRAAGPNLVANYVEGFNAADNVHFTFDTSALPKGAFNDRLLVITQADLMATVEPIVAANVERDVVPLIQSYYTSWNAYPFPAAFAAGTPPPDPGPGRLQSAYQGVAGRPNGLLPIIDTSISTSPNWGIAWDLTSIVVSQTGGTGIVNSFDCSASTVDQIVCRIDYDSAGGGDRPIIQVQSDLRKAALSFIKPVAASDVSMTQHDGVTPAAWTSGPTLANTLKASGDGTLLLSGQLDSAATNNKRVFITISRPVSYLPVVSDNPATNPNGAWFIANLWYRQAFFAVSQGFLPGGGNACPFPPAPPPPPACLTVNNLRPSYLQWQDKRAILVLTGRFLGINNTRPSASLGDYLESANLVAALGPGTVYENRLGAPTSINDRVVVISP